MRYHTQAIPGAQLTVTNTAWSEVSLLNSSEANGVYTYTIRAVISDYVGTVADFRDMDFILLPVT